jgi:hypothetical protein
MSTHERMSGSAIGEGFEGSLQQKGHSSYTFIHRLLGEKVIPAMIFAKW